MKMIYMYQPLLLIYFLIIYKSLVLMIIDLTSFVKNQLNNHPQPTTTSVTKISQTIKCYAMYTEDTYNSLIKIRNILDDSRQNYFSNASYSFEAYTDRQRDELNELVKRSLDEVSNQINELNDGLKKQVGLKSTTEKQYLKAVVLCLFQFFKKIEGIYREFQLFSLKRKKKIEETIAIDKQAEKAKYKTPKIESKPGAYTDETLERQAGILFVQKVKQQTQLKDTKLKIESINELMANMSNIVLDQELQTSSFLQIGQTGLFHIQRGNKNLVEANILAKQTGKYYSLTFYALAIILLVVDFLKS